MDLFKGVFVLVVLLLERLLIHCSASRSLVRGGPFVDFLLSFHKATGKIQYPPNEPGAHGDLHTQSKPVVPTRANLKPSKNVQNEPDIRHQIPPTRGRQKSFLFTDVVGRYAKQTIVHVAAWILWTLPPDSIGLLLSDPGD